MRWFLSFCLGTVLSTGFLGIFTWANGTPLPPLGDWEAMARYPTGSVATTLEVMWIIYSGSFVLVFALAWACRKMRRKARTEVRPPTPDMSGTRI